jgi:hypothetical protein
MLKAQRDLNILMDNLPDCIYFKDLDSRFLHVNDAMVRKFGKESASQLIGKTDADFFVPFDAKRKLVAERRVMTGEGYVGVEELEVFIDGRKFWVSTTKMPLRDNNGNIVGTFGVSRDITSRKIWENRLDTYRIIVESANDLIYTRSKDGVITSINGAAFKILGYVSDDLVGTNILSLVADSHKPLMERRLKRLDKSYQRDQEILPLITKDGRVVFLAFTARPLRDRDTKKALIVSIGHDITDITESNNKLKDLVRQVQHASKDSLQLARSLLKLQRSVSTDSNTREVLEETAERIRLMMEIQDYILSAADIRVVHTGSFLSQVINSYAATKSVRTSGISCNNDIDNITLAAEKAVPLGLMLSELLTNSLKHAFNEAETGIVAVTFKVSTESLATLCCSDNGCGLKDKSVYEDARTLGCKLVKLWATQLRGKLIVDGDMGTKISVTFPVQTSKNIMKGDET